MSVKIMIDSASDVNEQEAKRLGFLFVPIQVMFEGEEYFDGVNLLPSEFFDSLNAALGEKLSVRTSERALSVFPIS